MKFFDKKTANQDVTIMYPRRAKFTEKKSCIVDLPLSEEFNESYLNAADKNSFIKNSTIKIAQILDEICEKYYPKMFYLFYDDIKNYSVAIYKDSVQISFSTKIDVELDEFTDIIDNIIDVLIKNF